MTYKMMAAWWGLTACGPKPISEDDSGTPAYESADADADADTDADADADADTDADPPPSPDLWGEASAGHANPTWLWSSSVEATAAQWRLNDGPWTDTDASAGQFSSSTDLEAGEYSVELRIAAAEGVWSDPAVFITTVEYFLKPGYWNGTARAMATSPLGHIMAVAAHNAYSEDSWSEETNRVDTLAALTEANEEGADLLELDVCDVSGVWRIQHNDGSSAHGARLADVLEWPALLEFDQPLYIEIKERDPTRAKIERLLSLVLTSGVVQNGRPVFFRSFVDERLENIDLVNEVLESGAHPLQAAYVRTHALYADTSFDETAEYTASILANHTHGHDGIAIERFTPDLFHLINFARDLNLGVAMWTVPESMGEVWCAGYREVLDALVIDYDISDCREVIQEDTYLAYMDAQDDVDGTAALVWTGDSEPVERSLTAADTPSVSSTTCCEGLLGNALDFTASLDDHLTLFDADNNPSEGFFVMVTVQFDDLSLGFGDKQSIVAKSDDGGFALELKDDLLWGTTLRWGVHVDGEYHWATKEVGGLDTDVSHVLIGSYDGDGRARLWVNNSDSGVDETSVLDGGVTLNDSPITIGADPEGWSDTRFHFDGKVQLLSIQQWRDH